VQSVFGTTLGFFNPFFVPHTFDVHQCWSLVLTHWLAVVTTEPNADLPVMNITDSLFWKHVKSKDRLLKGSLQLATNGMQSLLVIAKGGIPVPYCSDRKSGKPEAVSKDDVRAAPIFREQPEMALCAVSI